MQAQLTQRDHDNLIKQKIEQDNQPEKSASETQKKRAACKLNVLISFREVQTVFVIILNKIFRWKQTKKY